jgi:hypothetical protein
MEYIVIASVNKTSYMVRLNADCHAASEHKILDLSYCGLHEYGVEAAQAFDRKDMKSDHFISMALKSVTVSQTELVEIIENRNRQLEVRDLAEKKVWELEAQMKKLSQELANAREILAKNS